MSETRYDIFSPPVRQDTRDVELQPFNSVNSRIDPDFSRDHRPPSSSSSLQGLHSQVGRYSWHIICLGLHATFTILYLAQIPIMHRGLERRIQVAVGRETDRISLAVQISLQALAIAYLSAALFVSQKLFMHRLLIVQQTLTSSHDQYSSWLGLGSAAFALFKQRSAASNLKWLILIAMYLAASAVVKICTAALFQMSPETIVQTTPVNATGVAGDSLSRFMDGVNHDTLQGQQASSQQLSMVLNYIRFGSFETSGEVRLEGNTIYDLIPLVENATENRQVRVNAYTVHVDCKMLSLGDLLNIAPTNETNPAETGSYWWDFRALSWINLKKQQGPNQYVMPISTVYPILDSNGRMLNKPPLNQTTFVLEKDIAISQVELNGPQSDPNKVIQNTIAAPGQLLSCPQGMAYANHPLWGDGFATNTDVWGGSLGTDGILGLASCTFTWTASSENVDSVKRTLSQPRKLKTNSSWTEATADELAAGSASKWNDFSSYAGDLLMGGSGSTSVGFFKFWCNTTVPQDTSSAALINIFSLDIFSFKYLKLLKKESPKILLHNFENMLEEWLALNIWIYANADGKTKGFASNVVGVPKNVQVSQLTLRAVPVYAGFAASLIMLAVACAIVFTTPVLLSHPNEVGVLQLLWLSDVDIATEKAPTEANLRKAGLKTNISLVNGVGSLRRRD
ncbi:hypothetical protein DL96DRAFT_1821689 [Flagelloscypha sp. PMI_526]|nr:hypothetical protein DL96DRAFT_1821689 [Flagelloscypha sp. PMI_526]